MWGLPSADDLGRLDIRPRPLGVPVDGGPPQHGLHWLPRRRQFLRHADLVFGLPRQALLAWKRFWRQLRLLPFDERVASGIV
jgi:hypothetical protein